MGWDGLRSLRYAPSHHDQAFRFYLSSWGISVLRIDRHLKGAESECWCHVVRESEGVTFTIQEALNSPQSGQQGRFESIFFAQLRTCPSTSRHCFVLFIIQTWIWWWCWGSRPACLDPLGHKQPTTEIIFSWCATFRLGNSQSSIRKFLINGRKYFRMNHNL